MMKKLKESVTAKEFKILVNYVKYNPTLRANTKANLLKIYTLLYYTGARLNELPQIRNSNILEMFDKKFMIIETHKTGVERKIHFTDSGVKEIKKLFTELGVFDEPSDYKIVRVKGKPYSTPHSISLIQSVNKVMHEVLGDKYSSHSFRQGLITELGAKSVNPKIIQHYIGHRNIKTTMNYIKPSDNDIVNALTR